METIQISSIAGMVFSLLVALGLPITLFIVVKKRTKAKASSALIGAGTFIVFALVLEQILHTVVLKSAGTALTENLLLYAVYGGLAAGLFEETGRFLAMKYAMKKNLNRENALMYGVGHGGIEAFILIGVAEIFNIITSVIINSGNAESIFASFDQATLNSLSQLWTLPSYQFYMAGVERISAIMLHIGFSLLVYLAVKNKKPGFWIMAFGVHFIVDALSIVLINYIPMFIFELIMLIIAGLFIFVSLKICPKEDNFKIEEDITQ